MSTDLKTSVQAKLIGTLKRNNDKLNCLPGDNVTVNIEDKTITHIEGRKNHFIRPLMANVDMMILVMSAKEPEFNLSMLEKLLFQVYYNEAKPYIIINKCDLLTPLELESLKNRLAFFHSIGIPMDFISAHIDSAEIIQIKAQIQNSVVALSGPSGVGKSTLINRLQDTIDLETGEISQKLKRGKHTTKQTFLIPINENTFLCDTPGFLSLELPKLSSQSEILYGMPFLSPYFGQCKYKNCTHINEPHCYFKQCGLENSNIEALYHYYCRIYHTIFNRR